MLQQLAEEIEELRERKFEERSLKKIYYEEMHYYADRYRGLQDRIMHFNKQIHDMIPLDPVVLTEK